MGLIPEDWEVKSLGEIAFLKRGKFTPRPRNNPIYYGGNIPFVQTGDVTKSNGKIIDFTQTLNEEGLSVSVLFGKGTILMTIAANIGYSGILQIDMACPDSLVAIDGLEKADNYFLNFYFSFKREKLDSLSTSGAQKNLNIELLSPFKIPLPPLPEQTAIATALSDMASYIRSLEALIAKKRLIKQGAMQELLTPKEDWEVRKLGEVGETIIGLTYKPENIQSDGKLVLRSSNVQNGKLVFNDNVFVDLEISEKLTLRENDLLICVRNGSRDLIGKCALISGSAVGETFGAFMSVFRSEFNKFIVHLFKSDLIKSQIEEYLGATINQITNKSLNSFEIPFPSIPEQNRLASILNEMEAEIDSLENAFNKAKLIKQGMMEELLTGRTRLV